MKREYVFAERQESQCPTYDTNNEAFHENMRIKRQSDLTAHEHRSRTANKSSTGAGNKYIRIKHVASRTAISQHHLHLFPWRQRTDEPCILSVFVPPFELVQPFVLVRARGRICRGLGAFGTCEGGPDSPEVILYCSGQTRMRSVRGCYDFGRDDLGDFILGSVRRLRSGRIFN